MSVTEREREKLLGREYFFQNTILHSKNFCTCLYVFLLKIQIHIFVFRT